MSSSETVESPFLSQFTASFGGLRDPRQVGKVEHPLMNILLIGFCSILCGAEGWRDMELFGYSKRALFDKLLDLEKGIPSSDTFRRVFSSLDPFEIGTCFKSWVKESYGELIQGDNIAIDGKALRGTRKKGAHHWSHLVHAWSSELGVCIAQHKVSNKSNEITAIPELLDSLSIEGCWITIDAIGCQLQILRQIRQKKADYLIGLKGNQGSLLEQAEKLIEIQPSSDQTETIEKDHGRIESRRCEVISDLKWLDLEPGWEQADIQSIVKVESIRETAEKSSTETRLYVCSGVPSAKEALDKTRGHWGIENKLHWQLDLAFNEDKCRITKGEADQNLALFRKMALDVLKNGPYSKGGIKARMKRAAWDEEYLLDLILNLGYL